MAFVRVSAAATEPGSSPTGKGEPASGVSAPVPPMPYADRLPEKLFDTYTNEIEESTAAASGSVPARKGEPEMGSSAPGVTKKSIRKAETSFEKKLGT